SLDPPIVVEASTSTDLPTTSIPSVAPSIPEEATPVPAVSGTPAPEPSESPAAENPSPADSPPPVSDEPIEPTSLPVSAPQAAPAPEPAAETSFLKNDLFSKAFAATGDEALEAASTSSPAEADTTGASSSSVTDAGSDLLEIAYSLDGKEWQVLGTA